MLYTIKSSDTRKFIILLLCLALLILSSCNSKDGKLSFESIEVSEWSQGYEEKKPSLIIVSESDETSALNNFISAHAQEQVQEINFDKCFAVGVFLGWFPTSHEGVLVEGITRENNIVSINASAGNPTGVEITSSPYHLIKICKRNSWGQNVSFRLFINGDIAVEASHFIP